MSQDRVKDPAAATSTLFHEICTALLRCRTQSGLYPRSHPRLQATLSDLKETLAAYQEQTGQPFFLHVPETIEERGAEERKHRRRNDVLLAELLELRLIEKLALPPDVSANELHRFCSLLRKDALKQTAERDRILAELHRLSEVRLSFYELHDLPAVAPDDSPESSRSRSRIGDRSLKDLLESLPEELREPLRRHLVDPATAKRVLNVYNLVSKDSAGSEKTPENEVSLLNEIVHASVSAAQRSPAAQAALADRVIANFQSVIEFFETHAESLVVAPHLLLGNLDSEALKLDLAKFSTLGAALADEVESFQQHKQKLADLFKSRSDSDKPSWDTAKLSSETDAQPPSPFRRERPERSGMDGAASPNYLEDVSYDAAAIRQAIEGSNPYVNYLQVVLDLLHRSDTRESVSGRLSRINRKLCEAAGDKDLLRNLVAVASRCLATSELKEAHETLLTLLGKLESPTEILKLFEGVVVPEGGPELAERLLFELVDRNRQNAAAILSTFSSARDESLSELATRRLIFLSQNPALLHAWAATDPAVLLRREVFEQVVERIGVKRLTVAFKNFFASSTYSQAADFIHGLRPEMAGAEYVILAAAQHGRSTVKKTALRRLRDFPSPTVFATLMEIVKRNNYRDSPDLQEVEGALSALVAFDDPRVRAFIEEVLTRRSWLRQVYRKEIRSILSDLVSPQ